MLIVLGPAEETVACAWMGSPNTLTSHDVEGLWVDRRRRQDAKYSRLQV